MTLGNQKNERELRRQLSHDSQPEPPKGLLDALKEELPDAVEVAPEIHAAASNSGERSSSSKVADFRRPPAYRRWLIAASLVVAVGAGVLGLQLSRDRNALDGLITPQIAPSEPGEGVRRGESVERSRSNERTPFEFAAPTGDAEPPAVLSDPQRTEPGVAGRTRESTSRTSPVAAELKRAEGVEATEPSSESRRLGSDVTLTDAKGVGASPSVEDFDRSRTPLRIAKERDQPVTVEESMIVESEMPGLDPRKLTSGTGVTPDLGASEGAGASRESGEPVDSIAFAVPEPAPAPPSPRLNEQRQAGAATLLTPTTPATPAGTLAPKAKVVSKPRRDQRGVQERNKQEAEQELRSPGYIAGHDKDGIVADSGASPSTGGTTEPNEQPYGDVFFRDYGVNPFVDSEEDHLSTFGLDVDTASYAIVRRYLRDGNLPPREAVRLEEMVNSFDYGDPAPRRGDFNLIAEGAPTPFVNAERYRLLRLAVKAREVHATQRKSASLTFVVDISGSMDRENRLGLVKEALNLLIDELRPDDSVALVVYGSRARVVIPHTHDRRALRQALWSLSTDGSTNAEEGLRLAYQIAGRQMSQPGHLEHFDDDRSDRTERRVVGEGGGGSRSRGSDGRIHRVILCSDGVANVGATGPESILATIGEGARQGIELTTVGFGMGNYNDVLMEQLADQGNGRYAYVDDLAEAERIFVEDLTGTLQTIAGDAKAQVEFDPEVVDRWRLVGYENRDIADHRFRDDTVDAGEIGAGHTASALYEIRLRRDVRPSDVVATLRLRYRSTETRRIVEVERKLTVRDLASSWHRAPESLRLAAVAAQFGELLKGSFWARKDDPNRLAREASAIELDWGSKPGGDAVRELSELVDRALRLGQQRGRFEER